MEFRRDFVETLEQRILEPRAFIQIVMGPRQTGKSTAVKQALDSIKYAKIVHVFNRAAANKTKILEDIWRKAREVEATESPVVLSLDEIQLVPEWSSLVKTLWDEDTRDERDIRVILTGSSSLLIRKGISESLMGRFEITRSTHWSFWECIQAFDYSLDDFLYFGGYPGAAKLKKYEERWYGYLRDAVIEPTLSIDVLDMEDVRKPALMRALFEVGASYSCREISYRKLLGQLDDRGNTATIASYLGHLSQAGLLSGLHKYDEKLLETKSSSPRLLVHDTSLMVAASGEDRTTLLEDPDKRGHLTETAVGAYLLARSQKEHFELFWWRENNKEVDFVVKKGRKRTAIEVKSGKPKGKSGICAFLTEYPNTYSITVGTKDFTIEDFLLGKIPLFQ